MAHRHVLRHKDNRPSRRIHMDALRRLGGFCLIVAAFVLTTADPAHAGQKLGDVINNVIGSWDGVHNILSTVAYLAGSFLGVAALFKFKDHVDNPQQTRISEGVKRMLAGGMFLSLPFMFNAVRGSLFGTAAGGSNTIEVESKMTNATLSPGGLDKMVVDVISNIAGPMEAMLGAFSYLGGAALLLVGISRLTKRMEEGPRGPAGFGTVMTFIAAGALMSFGDSMGTFTSSLFGDNELKMTAGISATVIADVDDRERIQTVIEGVMIFVMLVGYIAFIRGWFVLKAFADGGQQNATLAQGLTFLFGGALCINLGELVNALSNTVGVTALTFS